MINTYLGQIENGKHKVMVYANDNGYVITFHTNGNQLSYCELLDDEHIIRELKHLGYLQSFIDVVLSMI